MTDRPIIFSAPMILALLDGRKTMTRRLATRIVDHGRVAPEYPGNPDFGRYERIPSLWLNVELGDRLWVRESIALCDLGGNYLSPVFAADNAHVMEGDHKASNHYFLPKKSVPSIHMPRWASRLTLIVTGIKIERLQDISEEDAKAEGATFHDGRGIGHSGWRHDLKDVHKNARSSFARLWNELYGAGAWEANHELVAISFRVVRANIDKVEEILT